MLAALLLTTYSYAQQDVPELAGHIIDRTGTLTKDQISNLNTVLSDFESHKGSQIAVLMVATTGPESIEQYSIQVADKWKVGRKKVDDGVILIISKSDRKLRIEVGYGLEGVLTDANTKRIIDQIIAPRFKENDFYGGIFAGLQAIISAIEGEALPDASTNQYLDRAYLPHVFPILVFIVLVMSGILRSILSRVSSSLITGGIVIVLVWSIFGVFSIALAAGLIATIISFVRIGFGINGGFGGGGGGGGFGGGGSSGRW